MLCVTKSRDKTNKKCGLNYVLSRGLVGPRLARRGTAPRLLLLLLLLLLRSSKAVPGACLPAVGNDYISRR